MIVLWIFVGLLCGVVTGMLGALTGWKRAMSLIPVLTFAFLADTAFTKSEGRWDGWAFTLAALAGILAFLIVRRVWWPGRDEVRDWPGPTSYVGSPHMRADRGRAFSRK